MMLVAMRIATIIFFRAFYLLRLNKKCPLVLIPFFFLKK